MNWLKLLVQRRLLAAALASVAGWFGLQGSETALADVGVALVTFVPALLNLLSYFSKFTLQGLEPAMIAGVVPLLAALAGAAGVPIPQAVQDTLSTQTTALIAAVVSLLSAVTTNDVQPAGKLASPNP